MANRADYEVEMWATRSPAGPVIEIKAKVRKGSVCGRASIQCDLSDEKEIEAAENRVVQDAIADHEKTQAEKDKKEAESWKRIREMP